MDVKVKRRGWVKNAVIVFLAVMLVLTFFSNTFMNRSLAQVSTEYVSPGTLSPKIRGTGTVVANAPYEVKINEGRRIQSVLVKVGDNVEVGDVLIRLTEEADTKLKEEQDMLDELKYNYQVFLLGMADRDYTVENRDIKKMREEITKLESERDALMVSDAEISAAKIAIDSAQTKYDKAQEAANEVQTQLDIFDSTHVGGGELTPEILESLNNAKVALEAAEIQYGVQNEFFENVAAKWEGKNEPSLTRLEALNNIINSPSFEGDEAKLDERIKGYFDNQEEAEKCALAYRTIRDAKAVYEKALQDYESALNDSNVASARAGLEAAKKEADALVITAEKELTDAKAVLDTLDLKKNDYKLADDALDLKRDALEDAIFNLSQSQKSDNKRAQKDQLDISKMKKQIDEQQAIVDKLTTGDMIYEITSNAAGVVSSINVVAGALTVPEETLMTIDQSDRGFTLSFSVTNEQARKVQVGTYAEVSTSSWWFDGKIDAVLSGISSNTSDPKNSKMLNFTINGDVSGGDQLSLSIGERSQNYELIVPKNAIRTDSNGSYVLLLEQKPSALGNRYYATRIDVEVIESDDKQSAITGALSSYDYVITNSSMPVEPGDMVRLTEK